MKAILEFNLPEDSYEFEAACNGNKYKMALNEAIDSMRNDLKYKELSSDVQDYIEKFRDDLIDKMAEEGLTRN